MKNLKKELSSWISEHKCYHAAYTPQYMVYHVMIDLYNKIDEKNYQIAQSVFDKLKHIY